MRTTMTLVLVLGLVGGAVPRFAVAEAPGIQQLLENARHWRDRNRPDKAAEAWRKLLQAAPDHQQALVELAIHEASAGRKAEAGKYLARLERVNPAHPDIPRVRRMLDMGPRFGGLLDEARALVRQKKVTEAIAKYREAFGKDVPGGRLGIEFYTTLGGQPGGWDEARTGLERLAKVPGDLEAALALAKHLTYREQTRREGVRQLVALSGTAVGSEARAAWKKALMWMQLRPGDRESLLQYLKQVGEDKEIRVAAHDGPRNSGLRIPGRDGRMILDRVFLAIPAA